MNKAISTATAPLLFRVLYPWLAKFSLERLVDISRHPMLSKYVRELRFGVAWYQDCGLPVFLHRIWLQYVDTNLPPAALTLDNLAKLVQVRLMCKATDVGYCSQIPHQAIEILNRQRVEEAYTRLQELARFAVDREAATALLTQALSRLPAVHRIVVNGDFAGGGNDSVLREIFLGWKCISYQWDFKELFMVIAEALASSGRELSQFEVSGISQDTLLDFSRALGNKSDLILKGLKSLKLLKIFTDDSVPPAYLNSFTHLTPSLTEFRYRSYDYIHSEIRQASGFLSPKLRFLRTLDITGMKFSQQSISGLLQTYSDTLGHLGLAHIEMVGGNWVQLFDELPAKFSLQILIFIFNEEDDPVGPNHTRSVEEYFDGSQTPYLLAFMNGQSTVNPLRKALEDKEEKEKVIKEGGSDSGE